MVDSRTVNDRSVIESMREDALRSLAEAASQGGYVKPRILAPGGEIRIRQGRHPVVERMLPEGTFIANDTCLDQKGNRIAIITGPNMAGKSTYMRQVAVLTLMAQAGSFVPAAEASISVADRIFTRVGASVFACQTTLFVCKNITIY